MICLYDQFRKTVAPTCSERERDTYCQFPAAGPLPVGHSGNAVRPETAKIAIKFKWSVSLDTGVKKKSPMANWSPPRGGFDCSVEMENSYNHIP